MDEPHLPPPSVRGLRGPNFSLHTSSPSIPSAHRLTPPAPVLVSDGATSTGVITAVLFRPRSTGDSTDDLAAEGTPLSTTPLHTHSHTSLTPSTPMLLSSICPHSYPLRDDIGFIFHDERMTVNKNEDETEILPSCGRRNSDLTHRATPDTATHTTRGVPSSAPSHYRDYFFGGDKGEARIPHIAPNKETCEARTTG
ncbi:hypothetical protein E2C01_058927 [Portunus trituberculatus]|uniref:Uncharacterized protein n=1 Tax=Portunus trituberculatus TaxID=210409 RepID=A0A5B7H4H7_PORTR|nr:hypothetical protein [Portunus trituberculatus]